jgi:cardiolipin synthase A/B
MVLTQGIARRKVALILPLVMIAASCSSVHPSARRPQANDLRIASRHIAEAIYRSTIVSVLRQPITTARTGFAMVLLRPVELIRSNLPAKWIAGGKLTEAPGTASFEKMLDRLGFPRAVPGKLKWLIDGAEFFPELSRQIAAAQESIRIQIYIFDNDDVGSAYADQLKKRSASVSVNVLFDDFGTTFAATAAPKTLTPHGFSPPPDMEEYLKTNSKVRVRRILNPWLVADHTKLLVFDQKTAILGGMNIGREYFSEWHDLMVRVEGPIVFLLGQHFIQAWHKAGPRGDFSWIRPPSRIRRTTPLADCIALRALRTDPAVGRHEILDSILLAIRGSRHRIWIENPYFANDEIVAAVSNASQRGVDVRVILPATSDSFLMDSNNMTTAHFLIKMGVKVYRYPGMAHTKAIICDNWATVGSANLDVLSLRINRELNLSFNDPNAVRSLEETLFLPDIRRSQRLSLAETLVGFSGIAEAVADQF